MTTINAFTSIVTILTALVTAATTISATTTASVTTTRVFSTSASIAFTLGYGGGGSRYCSTSDRVVMAMVVVVEVVMAVSTSVVKTITM
ncbi:hypothetical protein H5410_050825, partial [Solanum commersonii]